MWKECRKHDRSVSKLLKDRNMDAERRSAYQSIMDGDGLHDLAVVGMKAKLFTGSFAEDAALVPWNSETVDRFDGRMFLDNTDCYPVVDELTSHQHYLTTDAENKCDILENLLFERYRDLILIRAYNINESEYLTDNRGYLHVRMQQKQIREKQGEIAIERYMDSNPTSQGSQHDTNCDSNDSDTFMSFLSQFSNGDSETNNQSVDIHHRVNALALTFGITAFIQKLDASSKQEKLENDRVTADIRRHALRRMSRQRESGDSVPNDHTDRDEKQNNGNNCIPSLPNNMNSACPRRRSPSPMERPPRSSEKGSHNVMDNASAKQYITCYDCTNIDISNEPDVGNYDNKVRNAIPDAPKARAVAASSGVVAETPMMRMQRLMKEQIEKNLLADKALALKKLESKEDVGAPLDHRSFNSRVSAHGGNSNDRYYKRSRSKSPDLGTHRRQNHRRTD